MLIRILAMTGLLLCCSIGQAEEKAVEIPLSEIWAKDIPGTKNIYELDKETAGYPLMSGIGSEHRFKKWEDKAGPAFVVKGSGLQALKNAHAVILGKQPRVISLSEGVEASIVFFALQGPAYVHLTKVEKTQNTFKVKYEFLGHGQKHITSHFAIIPLGRLSKGHFTVEIAAEGFAEPFTSDPGRRENPDERKLRRVSSSFEFDVK